MKITAIQVERWADTRDAQAVLPILIRRLISATCKTTEMVIPGGDSVGTPGWDGRINVSDGNAWVPSGESRWEMGCTKRPGSKAQTEFRNRGKQTTADEAANNMFVFVTPRRWRQKGGWQERARSKKIWRDVRVIDADDLEAWLENAPGVALWFGEQLGVRGSGIESIERYWNIWSGQAHFRISADAIFTGRGKVRRELHTVISKDPQLLAVEADSREEAVAFVCAQLLSDDQRDYAACITNPDGWRFADANPQLRIGLATSPEVAGYRAPKDGFTLVVPLSRGDEPASLSGCAAEAAGESRIVLERPRAESFEEALRHIGEEASDAERLTRVTGRSWSIYRRTRSRNPAVRRPAWLAEADSRCLVAIMLVGAWNSAKAGDRICLEAISERGYDELESQLRRVARLDDSPVLQIGSVWKAKAPIELLYLFGPEITCGELRRFFSVAEGVLSKPDPALELEDSERWMAEIYGKAREESGLAIDSLVDSLAKLRVYAERATDANAGEITAGVDGLVRTLLDDATESRWLSLTGVLRGLAEASPDEFLKAVEGSLRRPDAPVRRLLGETGEGGAMGRCWHADLLWALELLAWYPTRLARVADILAQLTTTPIKGNWSNTPARTLSSLFRHWWTQTAAREAQRIEVIDRLIRTRNGPAWDLLYSLVPTHGAWATANAKPRWRDDDAGVSQISENPNVGHYISEIAKRLIDEAKGRPERIAELIEVLDRFEGLHRESLMHLVESSVDFDDAGRELVRDRLRRYLSWHNSFNLDGSRKSREAADRLRRQFDALAPVDLVRRHAWLFINNWAELPDGREDDYEQQARVRDEWRAGALSEILAERELQGIVDLAEYSGNPWLVGRQVAHAGVSEAEILSWTTGHFVDAGRPFHDPLVSGLLHALAPDKRVEFVKNAVCLYEAELGGSEGIAAYLSNAPCQQSTWKIVEGLDTEGQNIYWRGVRPGYLHEDGSQLSYLIDRLVAVGRHRTAFQAIQPCLKEVDGLQLAQLLEGIRAGAEPAGPLPDGWHLGEAIDFIQRSGKVSQRQLALLEFAFFGALEHTKHGAHNLIAEMVTDPVLFMECVCLVYKPRNREPEPVDESMKPAADLGWRVLHDGRGVPGTQADGSVDLEAFNRWVDCVRHIATEQDRLGVTDTVIGQWLSQCPADANGTWPCLAVRDLLDRPDGDDIRDGFACGVANNRGVTSRSYDEGGNQERALAQKYRGLSIPLLNTHPQVAAVLERVARNYEADARSHDLDARLRIEGH